MRNRFSLLVIPGLTLGAACVRPVNTVPPPVTPTSPVQYYDLEIPAELEIKAVDFSAANFSDVSGGPETPVSSSLGGRAFVKVYAVQRGTGDQYLLLYEDVSRRKRPVQIIRFARGTVPLRPDGSQ